MATGLCNCPYDHRAEWPYIADRLKRSYIIHCVEPTCGWSVTAPTQEQAIVAWNELADLQGRWSS